MADKIITCIEAFNAKTSFNNKSFVCNKLKQIEDKVTEKESELVTTSVEILSKCRLTQDEKTEVVNNKKQLIKIIRKYEEEFEESGEASEEPLDENLPVDDVDKLLDAKVDKYKDFNQNHPMEGVSFDKHNKNFKIHYGNINKSAKKVLAATNMILEAYKEKFGVLSSELIAKKSFLYKKQYFITYWYNDELYFDILHIISI